MRAAPQKLVEKASSRGAECAIRALSELGAFDSTLVAVTEQLGVLITATSRRNRVDTLATRLMPARRLLTSSRSLLTKVL